MENNIGKKRNSNIELLRIISMLMIIFLHAIGKGKLLVNLSEAPSANGIIAWIIESFSISAVNIFVLVSGYFLIDSSFKVKRFFEIVFQTVFYSFGAYLVCALSGIDIHENINTYFLLHTVLPIHMNLYWFITSYLIVYIFLPLISAGVKQLSRQQFRNMLLVALIFESAIKSVLPVRLNEDEFGYNFLWFLIVFLVGAYLKTYGFKVLVSQRKGWICYIAASVLILVENIVLDVVIDKTGHLSEIAGISFEYNHILVLASAIGIFSAFIHMTERGEIASKIICGISPMSLGVYLAHENLTIRYNWQKWLGIYDSISQPTISFLPKLLLAVSTVYVIGTGVDWIRIKLFYFVGRIFEKRKTRKQRI